MCNDRTLKLSTIINLYSCFLFLFMSHTPTGPKLNDGIILKLDLFVEL